MANWWEQSEEKKKLEQKAQPAQPFRAPQQLVQNVLDTVQSAAQKVQKKAAEHAKQEAALPNWWKNSQERQGLQAKVSESRQYQSYLEKLKAAAPAQYAAETMGPAKLQRELGRSQEALRQAQEARSAARQQNQDWRPSYMTNIQPAQKDAYDLEYDRAYRDSAVMEQAQRIQNADRRENMYQSIRDRMEALKTGSPADYDAKVKAGREAFEAKQNSAREAEIWQAINEDRAWNPQLRDAGGSNYDKRIDSSLLSNQQKNHFYALYAEDPEQAEEWLGTAYERQQNKMLDTVSTLAGYNAGTRAVAAVGSAAMGLASGLDPYNDFGQGASKIANALASGGAKGLQEKGLFNTGILAGTIDEDVPIIGGKGLGDLYQLSVSMLQSGALVLAAGASGGAAPVVELLGTTLMGSSAAASDYTDCIENRGMSRDQAMLHATAAGIAEAAFEYVSLDKLVNQDITRGFIKNFFMQGGIEASEELCTTVANRITDAALARAGGYDNQIEQRMKELIALGLDTREAKAKAEREWVTELISDGLGGFLSGGAMTGINTGLHAGDYNRMNRYLEQTGRDSMRSGEAAVLRQYAEDNGLGWYGETEMTGNTDSSTPVEASAQNDEGTDSSPAAQNDGETAQASDATSSASQSEAPSPQGEGTEKKSRKESRQERMGQRQTGSDVERIQKHMNQQMEGKSIQEQQALRDQLQERYGEGILPAAYAAIQEDIRNVTQDMSPDQIQRAMTEALKQTNDREMRGAIAQAYSQAGAEAANKKGGSSEVAKFYQQMRNTGRGGMTMQATVTAQDGTRQQMEIQNFTEDGKGIRLSNGQTVAINKDLNKNLEADADTVDAIQRLAEFGLGKDTDAVFQLYKATSPQTKTDGYRWIMDAAMAYDQGRVGRISMLEAMRRSSLDRQTVAQLYKMGQRSDTADTQARQARIDQARQEAGQESQAKVDAKAIKGIELTETEKEQFEMANDIFRAIGVDLVWFASDADGDGTFRGKNGAYLNGKVYLDIHAGRNFASDLRSGILATAGHELTHFLQDYAPKAYKSLRRFLLDQIAGNAANGELTLERLIDDKMRRSSEGITREEALDEVAADACQRMLLDSKALHDYAEQAPGHMKRLRDWVKGWYERIKAAFGKSTELSYEARLMNGLAEDVREAFGDLWDAALREAVETHREVGNLKGEKNTAQEGGVKYSERDTQEILHLKEQIRQAQNTLNRMPIVGTATSEIVFDENNVSAAVDWACSKIGVPKAVHREGFGDVLFDRKRVNKGFNYLPGRKGSAGRNLLGQAYTVAVTLAPQVVQSGIEINHHINHKNYGHDTWTFAAPVQIDGERGNLAVVVKKTSNNYYDVHSILTPDGGLMVLDATKKAEASDGGVFLPEAVTPSKLSADFSILDSSEKSNPSMEKYSERDYSYDFSDTDLILDAADLAADPETAESYWKELLATMDQKDARDARAQLKGIREQGKKIQDLEAKLEDAMHQMEQTDRKLRTQGINSRVDLFRERLARTNEELRANKAERALNDTTRKLNETARKLSSTAKQLQKQLEREQRILNGMLKPPAIQKLLKAEREKAVTKAEEHKDEVFRNYKERKHVTETVNRIRNMRKELQRMLTNPTDRSYIPAELAGSVVGLLDALEGIGEPKPGTTARERYDDAARAARNMAKEYGKLKNDEDYAFASEYDDEIDQQIQEIESIISVRARMTGDRARAEVNALAEDPTRSETLDLLTAQDYEEIYAAVRAVRDSLKRATKMLNSSQWNDVYDAIRSVVDQQQSMTSFADAKKHEQNKRLRMLDNMSVMRAVEMMSGWDRNAALYQLMHGVENGARDAMGWVMNYNKSLLDLKTGKNEQAYRRALSKTEDFGAVDKTSGTAVKMTKLQAIQLYMTWQREAHNDKLLHLQKGGATIRDAIAIQDGKGSRAASHTIKVTPELIARINDSFTDWDRAYMKAVRDYLTREAKATNQVRYKLKHRVLTTEDYYVPYIVDKGYLETKLEGSDVFNLFVKTPGSTQALQKKAPQPVIIDGMDTMLAKHVQDTANYVGLALPIRDFAKVYNGRLAAEEDGEVYTSLKKTIQDNFQDKGLNLIVQALLDVQGGSKGNSWSTHIAETLNKLQGAFVRSALLINPSVTLKQAASYTAAESVLSYRALVAGNRPIFTGQDQSNSTSLIAQIFSKPEGKTAQRLYDEIDQHTSLHYERRLRISQAELANEAQRSGKFKRWRNSIGAGMEQSSLGHGVRKAGEMLNPVTWIQRMDVATTAALWVAAKEQARMDLGITNSSPAAQNDAFWQRTTELYERVIRETQPMYDGLHRTANQKQHGGLMQYIFPFRTVPIQNHGQISAAYEGMQAAIESKDKARIQEAKRFFAKTVKAQIQSAVIFSVFTFLAAGLKRKTKKYRDEDEELDVLSVLKGIGMDTAGTIVSVLFPLTGSALWDGAGNIYDSVKNGKKLWSYDSFSIGPIDLLNEGIKSFGAVATDTFSVMKGADVSVDTWEKDLKSAITNTLKFIGIPASTITTYYEGIKGDIDDALNGRIPALNDESWERATGVNVNRYAKAWEAGDSAKMQAVIAEMNRNLERDGKSTDGARDAVSKAAKELYEAGEVNVEEYMDFLRRAGYLDEEKIQNKVRDILRDELSTGDRSEEDVISALMEYVGWDEDKAWKKVREWSETAEHAEDEDYSYSTYKPLYEAIDANHEIADMVAEMTAHGIQESNIKSQVKGYLVEQYVAGKVSKDKLKNQLSRYCKIVATDDVSKILNDADCKKACGYGTGELNEAYRAGNLDSSTVSSMLQRYGGMSAADAKKRVRWLDLQKANPSLEVSESNCNNWYDGSAKSRENGHESAKAAGMSIEQYLQAKAVLDKAKDANGNGTGEDEVIAALSQMNLTARQKDALYYERYKGTTKYSKKTW